MNHGLAIVHAIAAMAIAWLSRAESLATVGFAKSTCRLLAWLLALAFPA